MIDNKLRSKIKKDCSGVRINQESRFEYEQRLVGFYTKQDQKRCFLDQLLQGSGSELADKFWSVVSSSRLAFDTYSWLAEEESCVDIQLEFKLPGILSNGRESKANMDVMIETENDIWFIESKYTESVDNKTYEMSLPEAYWKDYEKNGHKHSYRTADRKKYVYDCPLEKRFDCDAKIADEFKKFCEEINSLSKSEGKDWFDAKQETCHLFGILKYILENKPEKKVHFANIVYHIGEEYESEFSKQFRDRAKELIKNVTRKELDYRIAYVQDVVEKYGDKKAFGSDKTVKKLFESYPDFR